MPARRIGEILIAEGVLTEALVNRALGYQRVSGEHVRLGTILLNWDLLAEDALLQALARYHRVQAAPWSVLFRAPIEVTRLISPAMAIRLGAFPFAASGTDVHVAFLEPSNLAAADEVSAVTSKRVVPAIALEIRLLQAHQKYYGRHVPLEYRAIVQKLERRTTKAKLPDPQKTVDFRLRDLAEAENDADRSAPPPPPGIRTPPMDLGHAPIEHGPTRPRTTPIRVSRGLAHADLNKDALPTIEIPEMPKLNPPPATDRLSDTNPLQDAARAATRESTLSDTHPVGRAPEAPNPAPLDKHLDDTLPKRMGTRFASLSGGARPAPPEPPEIIEAIEFHPEPPPARPGAPRQSQRSFQHREADGDDTLPRGAAAHLAARDSVADMWRPARDESPGNDATVSRMWTPSTAELEASMSEARTRDEIGQVALETFLAKLPRVVLLGCGKSAVTGWQGRGKDVTPPFLSSLRISLAEDTVFASIQASGVPHFGPLDQAQWPPELAECLGDRAPDCAIFPIRILDGIAGFLYADRLGEPMHYEDFAVIARASAATANALARFLLRPNTAAPVS